MGYTLYKKIEKYPVNAVIKYRGIQGIYTRVRTGIKSSKTVYLENGTFKQNLLTGELVPKSRIELMEVDRISKQRSKTIFNQILDCNEWSFMGTLTFNGEKQDRLNDNEVYKRHSIFVKALKRNAPSCYYTTVIERHKKDEAIHFHMLFGGATLEELKLITPLELKAQLKAENEKRVEHWEKPKDYIKEWRLNYYPNKDDEGRTNYCFRHFCKYGRNTVTEVEDSEKAKSYLVKHYLQKDFGAVDKGRKRYFVSRNCKRPDVISEEQHFHDIDSLDIEQYATKDLKKYGHEFSIENVKFMKKDIDYCKYNLGSEIKLTALDKVVLYNNGLDREEKKEHKALYTWVIRNMPREVARHLKQENIAIKHMETGELLELREKIEKLIAKRRKAIETVKNCGIVEILKEFERLGNIEEVSTIQLVDMQIRASSYQEKFL